MKIWTDQAVEIHLRLDYLWTHDNRECRKWLPGDNLSPGNYDVRLFLFLNQRVIFIIFSCEIQKSLHIITDIFSFFPNHTDFNKERRF